MRQTQKQIKCTVLMVVTLSLVVITTLATAAPAPFHNGSTGSCEGCHGKRLGVDGDGTPPLSSPGAVGFMLKGSDASSTCLLCHEAPAGVKQPQDHYVATNGSLLAPGMPPIQLSPAGDFGWLKKNYRWLASENLGGRVEESSLGERHGHNIVAMDFGYVADSRNAVAPGGTFRSQELSCTSCHDPHGNYKRYPQGIVLAPNTKAAGSGSYTNSPVPTDATPVGTYRLLAGKGYAPKGSGTDFRNDPPAAVAPPAYNRRESFTDTRVAYGRGMSEWCQNCHSLIHGSGGGARQHPTGEGARLSQDVRMNYNAYVASGNLNGSAANAYSSMVPFEMGTDDYAELKDTANSNGSNTRGPTGDAQVMCLSCHRGHASGWDSMTRWNVTSEFIVSNGKFPGIDDFASAQHAQGRTSQEIRKTFYDRPASKFAGYQRSLCNKCHAKD